MSSSEVLDRLADTLKRAADVLAAAISDPDRVPDPELRALIANAVRLYAVKAETACARHCRRAVAASLSRKRCLLQPISCML
jgi:hypothetical protein